MQHYSYECCYFHEVKYLQNIPSDLYSLLYGICSRISKGLIKPPSQKFTVINSMARCPFLLLLLKVFFSRLNSNKIEYKYFTLFSLASYCFEVKIISVLQLMCPFIFLKTVWCELKNLSATSGKLNYVIEDDSYVNYSKLIIATLYAQDVQTGASQQQ